MNKQHAQLIDRLEDSGAQVLEAVRKISPEQMQEQQGQEWSLHQVLAHLRDTDKQVFLYRLERILDSDTPPDVPVFDQDVWSREHYSAGEPTENILSEFRRARRAFVKRLRDTTDKDWVRYAVHPQYGNIPVEYIATHTYAHTLEHLAQFVGASERDLLARAAQPAAAAPKKANKASKVGSARKK